MTDRPRIRIVYDDERAAHIARHCVEIEEVFEVAAGGFVRLGWREGKVAIVGPTNVGRILVVVLGPREPGVYGLVTAREATEAERRRLYHGRRQFTL